MGAPLEQVRAEAEAWDEWAYDQLFLAHDEADHDHPCPLPAPWVQPDPARPVLIATWGDWVATAEATAEGNYLEWAWSLRFGEDVPLDAGTVDWLHEALAAAGDALPAGVAG